MTRSLILLIALMGCLPALAHQVPPVKVTKTVAASKATVWRLWTTDEGIRSFFGQDVNLKLEKGGAYEVLFDLSQPAGTQGSEGCTVIDFKELEMLQFTWNAPPKFGEAYRTCNSKVTVTLEEIGPYNTKVTVVHDGWGHGGQWDNIRNYFAEAWPQVLNHLEKRCSTEWMNDFQVWTGLWKTMDGREIYEEWKSGDGKLTGTSFSRRNGERKQSETLELVWKPDGVYYIPTVSGQNNNEPVPFKLTGMDGTSWTFENAEHDFPQVITYQRIGNELKAYLEGTVDGEDRSFSISYTATQE